MLSINIESKIAQSIPVIRAEVINPIIDQTEKTHGTPALHFLCVFMCVCECITHKVKERQRSLDELL